MNFIERLHEKHILRQRVNRLADHFSGLLDPSRPQALLDVGAGDGLLARSLAERCPCLQVEGCDVLVRETTCIPVKKSEGTVLPYPDASFDAVMLADVLHHAEDPRALLKEAARVSRRHILIKDHFCDGFLAFATLRFMDDVHNKRDEVALPYTYWKKRKWFSAFTELDLKVESIKTRLALYPWPLSCFFDRSLHFIAKLSKINR